MSDKFKSIALRFVKSFISGAFSVMALITATNIQSWGSLKIALSSLALSALIGGINGVLMAGHKYFTWTE